MKATTRKKIDARLNRLSDQLTESLTSYRREYDELARDRSPDVADAASRTYELDYLNRQIEDDERRLERTRNAIQRLATGHYGVCATCGSHIDEGRMIAQPYAMLCIECATTRDRRGGRAVQAR
jgi:DnaK suppressor protein